MCVNCCCVLVYMGQSVNESAHVTEGGKCLKQEEKGGELSGG